MRLLHEIAIFQTVKSKVIISLFETVKLSVSISLRNVYNSLNSIKESAFFRFKVVHLKDENAKWKVSLGRYIVVMSPKLHSSAPPAIHHPK